MNNSQVVGTLTDTYLRYGIVSVGKKGAVQLGLPASGGSVKVEVLFDSGKKSHSLVYDTFNGRFFGVKGWYVANHAQKGDRILVETVIPAQRYRFRFTPELSKGTASVPEVAKTTKTSRDTSVVGKPINYRGLVYAPVNEQGVVLLFGMLFEELGMIVEEVKNGFPDAIIRRYNGKGWVRERVEFEYMSLNFKKHQHAVDDCDIIVCWSHNWKDCPLEVIDLAKFINIMPAHARPARPSRPALT